MLRLLRQVTLHMLRKWLRSPHSPRTAVTLEALRAALRRGDLSGATFAAQGSSLCQANPRAAGRELLPAGDRRSRSLSQIAKGDSADRGCGRGAGPKAEHLAQLAKLLILLRRDGSFSTRRPGDRALAPDDALTLDTIGCVLARLGSHGGIGRAVRCRGGGGTRAPRVLPRLTIWPRRTASPAGWRKRVRITKRSWPARSGQCQRAHYGAGHPLAPDGRSQPRSPATRGPGGNRPAGGCVAHPLCAGQGVGRHRAPGRGVPAPVRGQCRAQANDSLRIRARPSDNLT